MLNHYTFGLFDGVGLSCDFPCLRAGKVGSTHLVGVGLEPRQNSIVSGVAGDGWSRWCIGLKPEALRLVEAEPRRKNIGLPV